MNKEMKADGKKWILAGAGGFLLIAVCVVAVWIHNQNKNEDAVGMVSTETERITAAETGQETGTEREQTDFRRSSCDAGVTENMSLEETLEYLRPTVVQLYHAVDGGGYTAASGFLIEMTEDLLYICTNRHVIQDYDDWDIFFYEGTKVCGHKTGVSSQYDVGVVEVEKSGLSDELLQQLMTVHIDMTYWEQLGTEELDIGLVRVGQSGDILYVSTGKLLRKETEFLWGNGEKETELKIEQCDGDSGSAIFDQRGNLISMVFGMSHDVGGDRNWGIPLKAIVASYKEITGRELCVRE